MRKVPMTKQISENRRMPAPTPETVELQDFLFEINFFVISDKQVKKNKNVSAI